MWLLRGGRVVRFERSGISGNQFSNWVHSKDFQLISEDFRDFEDNDEADFLDEKGQLRYELGAEFKYFYELGYAENDMNVFFMKEGVVHHPELFNKIVRGYNIDTSDFVINTAHETRANEPHHNV